MTFLLVKIHGTPLPTAPGSDIMAKYRSPLVHGVLQTAHVDDSTSLIVYCTLDESSFFLDALPFPLGGAISTPPNSFLSSVYEVWAERFLGSMLKFVILVYRKF